MNNENEMIFEKYLSINEAIVRGRNEGDPQRGGGTRKFGLSTGINMNKELKTPEGIRTSEMGMHEKQRRMDDVRAGYVEFAENNGEYFDLNEAFSSLPQDQKKYILALKKELNKPEFKDNILSQSDFKVYYFDFPRYIAILNSYANSILNDPKAKKGAEIARNLTIKKFKQVLFEKKNQLKENPELFDDNKGYKDLWVKAWLPMLLKFFNDPIKFSEDQKNWFYSQPMREVGGKGTGIRSQEAFLKPRSEEGKGSEAPLMPKGSTGDEGGLESRLGSKGVVRPIGPRSKQTQYTPIDRTPPELAPSLGKERQEKVKKKKKSVKKESYEPFIKLLPF